MNPKTLQYLMGHSDISVTMNVYTHIGFDDAEEELKRWRSFGKHRQRWRRRMRNQCRR
jgi:integrase